MGDLTRLKGIWRTAETKSATRTGFAGRRAGVAAWPSEDGRRRTVVSRRGWRVAWRYEMRFVIFIIAFCAVMMAVVTFCCAVLGMRSNGGLKPLCLWCAAVSAAAAYLVPRYAICHGVSRRTGVTAQYLGNVVVSAVVTVLLAVVERVNRAIDAMLASYDGFCAVRVQELATYPDALALAPRYLDDLSAAEQGWRRNEPNWIIFLVAAFAFVFTATMVGQLVGEACSRLGAKRTVIVLLVFVVGVPLLASVLMYANPYTIRPVAMRAFDAVDTALAFTMGILQHGSLEGGDWDCAFSLWPLLASAAVVSALCAIGSMLLDRRRELRPAVAVG